MALRWVIGDLLTGKIRADITRGVSEGSWADQLNAAAPISAKVLVDNFYDTASGANAFGFPLRNLTQPWKAYLGCIDLADNRVLAAGPITGRPWDDPGRAVTLTAAGMWQYMYRRVLFPAGSGSVLKRVLNFAATDNYGLPDIAVGMVQALAGHTGGALPIDLPGRIGGSATRTYYGYDLALAGDRLKDLVEVIGGPDIMFQPYLADETHIRWRMRTGGVVDPFIHGPGVQRFEYSAPENGITGLAIDEDSTRMVSRAFEYSGQDLDALLSVASDPYLPGQGYPLLETVTSRDNVTVQGTLDDYASEDLAQGRTPTETWTMNFARNERPFLSDYATGDWAQLNIVRHPWLQTGKYDVRIVGLSGDIKDELVKVTFQEGVPSTDVDAA